MKHTWEKASLNPYRRASLGLSSVGYAYGVTQSHRLLSSKRLATECSGEHLARPESSVSSEDMSLSSENASLEAGAHIAILLAQIYNWLSLNIAAS